nr:PREDICTED: GRAM domain-containing protein 1C isoform X1 [Lepisosteus oculatus]XP_015197251.1 PREDICTED: GRAM domain-containing protein 1C isoform X1 [Lepisosteus oculatus]
MAQVHRCTVGTEAAEDCTSRREASWSSEEHDTPTNTYKQRTDEFKKLFKDLPESERLIADYACALQRDILLQGRLYLTENRLCFHSNFFLWGTTITLTLKDITSMTREKTAKLIPNAIQVSTESDKYFFTSFSARERSYLSVFRMWQNSLLDKQLTKQEFWQMVRQHYGSDLGLNNEEMESLQVSTDSTSQAGSAMKQSGEEHAGRLERPSTLRLPLVETAAAEFTTTSEEAPQPSPVVLNGNALSVEEPRDGNVRLRTPGQPPDRHSQERVSKRSVHSLDLNSNEDRLTERSTSDPLEEEERLGSSQGQGRLYVNRVFHISAEKMFELLFTDSDFIRRFMSERKITGMVATPWKKDSSGGQRRTLNYTITISNPLIGKFSTATETQAMNKDSQEGQYYLVDAEVFTHDVPYHDYFYTLNRYCIIRSSRRRCRLRIYTDVKYKKQPWGLVKSFITKNSWSGLEDYFRHLETELLEEEAELNQGSGDPSKLSAARRRRRGCNRSHLDHLGMPGKSLSAGDLGPGSRAGPPGAVLDFKGTQKWSLTTIVAFMSLILLVLTVLNLSLFFKLWAMEDIAHRMHISTKMRLKDKTNLKLSPDLASRQFPHQKSQEERMLLRTVLQDSIHLLEQLRSSLIMLQRNFELQNKTGVTP